MGIRGSFYISSDGGLVIISIEREEDAPLLACLVRNARIGGEVVRESNGAGSARRWGLRSQ